MKNCLILKAVQILRLIWGFFVRASASAAAKPNSDIIYPSTLGVSNWNTKWKVSDRNMWNTGDDMHRSSKPQQPKFAHYTHIKNWISSPIKELHVPERLQSAIKFFKELNTCTEMNGCVEQHSKGIERVVKSDTAKASDTEARRKLWQMNPIEISAFHEIFESISAKTFSTQIYAKQMFGTRKVAAGRTSKAAE